jgi:MFS family permease
VPALSDPVQLNMASQLKSWILEKELSHEFWIFFVAALCYDFGFAMFLFLYNLFLLDHGFDERQLGLIAGAMTLGSVVATIPVGIVAQRIGLKRVLLTAFALLPPISVIRLFVLGERVQVGLAFLTGLSVCCWAVSFCPIAAKITIAKNRTFAFSLLMSVGIAAGGLGGLVGGFLPGWLQAFSPSLHAAEAKRAVLLLCCLIVAIGIWPVTRLSLRHEQEQQTSPWSFDPYLIRYLPAIALWSLASGAFIPFATAYLARYVNVPLPHIGLIISASQLAQVVAILFAPIVFRKCGLVVGITYTQLATAIALTALARTHNISLIVVLFLAFTGFHWMGGPGIYSLLMERVAEGRRSTASAANNLVTSLCQAIAAPIAGAAYVDFGYPTVLSAIAGVALLASFFFWLLLRKPGNVSEGLPASA